MCNPPVEVGESKSQWGPFDVLLFYCGLGKVVWCFKNTDDRRLFEILKMFYPPDGAAKAEPNVVHLTVFPFIGTGKGVWGFKNTGEDLFKILKMFYPPEGAAKAEP